MQYIQIPEEGVSLPKHKQKLGLYKFKNILDTPKEINSQVVILS